MVALSDQLKKARAWRKGIPWRTERHFWMTPRTVVASIGESLEKSKEREGRVRSGFSGDGLLGLGFLRWWSLIKEWIWVIRASFAGGVGEEEWDRRKKLERGERKWFGRGNRRLDLVIAIGGGFFRG